jgi:hypothetical protein
MYGKTHHGMMNNHGRGKIDYGRLFIDSVVRRTKQHR